MKTIAIKQQTPLLPWLCMNVKISYQCDRKRDIFKSIGLQLINGQMVEDFHDRLQNTADAENTGLFLYLIPVSETEKRDVKN